MTDLDASDPRTLPGFFDALAEGELLGGVCADCGQVLLPPRPACYACGSRAVDVEPQSPGGTIFSYTEVHAAPPAFAADAPYTVAVVELADGGRLLGRVDADYADVAIGDPVELTVQEPTAEQREAALDYEADWPVHRFELR
ncbi:Zn-ribbon domain-containing OB-fold protein [Halobaculum gomorrense]|uniref:DUF35 domain-containing protein n=1 Tax=Halobaculum gomorrense TaxID=43928 RepID=A0A1M5QM45_9EURY|nr:Zn-ribbon domain-containing OB-fold protein [Halobaculum gomorrense]SHH15185.1 hypothetical protein SAMN05443636_1966 [Halobaculum gomorrense]